MWNYFYLGHQNISKIYLNFFFLIIFYFFPCKESHLCFIPTKKRKTEFKWRLHFLFAFICNKTFVDGHWPFFNWFLRFLEKIKLKIDKTVSGSCEIVFETLPHLLEPIFFFPLSFLCFNGKWLKIWLSNGTFQVRANVSSKKSIFKLKWRLLNKETVTLSSGLLFY